MLCQFRRSGYEDRCLAAQPCTYRYPSVPHHLQAAPTAKCPPIGQVSFYLLTLLRERKKWRNHGAREAVKGPSEALKKARSGHVEGPIVANPTSSAGRRRSRTGRPGLPFWPTNKRYERGRRRRYKIVRDAGVPQALFPKANQLKATMWPTLLRQNCSIMATMWQSIIPPQHPIRPKRSHCCREHD